MINAGVYPDLSNEEYHADSAISRSGIMNFLESPFKFYANYIENIHGAKQLKESTPAMEFGSVFHEKILEPAKFIAHYGVKPKKVLLKDVGRKLYDEYNDYMNTLEKARCKILEHDTWCQLTNMELALRGHKDAWFLIEGAMYEQSYFWEDEHSGIMVKCRPDILHDNMIVDLKTIRSASSRTYQREMIDSGYHIQGAMIREGIKQCTGKDIKTVINVCIEKTYPYAIGIKIISESALEAGHVKFKQALLDIKRCKQENHWPSYEAEIVELPNWAL